MGQQLMKVFLSFFLLLFVVSGCTKTNINLDQSTSLESTPVQSISEESTATESNSTGFLSINTISIMEQIAKEVPTYTHEYSLDIAPYLFPDDPLSIYFIVNLTPPRSDADKDFCYIMKYCTNTKEWVVSDRRRGTIRSLELYDSSILVLSPTRDTVGGYIYQSNDLHTDFVWHNIDYSYDPLSKGQDTLYRIGFTNNNNHYVIAIRFNGDVVWKYPQMNHMDICDRVYYPLQGSFEKEGVFHLFCCEDDELWHVLLDVQTGEVLRKEFLQLDMYETWSIRSMGRFPYGNTHDTAHIIRNDHSVFVAGMYKQGTYVVKYELQSDGSLQEQWKQTYPNVYLHIEDIQQFMTPQNQQLVLTVWDKPYSDKDREDGYYYNNGTNVHFFGVDMKNGKTVWQYTITPPNSYANIQTIRDTSFSSSLCREIYYSTPEEYKYLHQLLYFDVHQGKPIWEETFENLHPTVSHGRITNPFLFAIDSQKSYVFDIENNTLLILNTVDGTTVSTHPLPVDSSEEEEEEEEVPLPILQSEHFLLYTLKMTSSYQCYLIPKTMEKP